MKAKDLTRSNFNDVYFRHLLPTLVATDDLRDQAAVVIDVLRATTTVAAALASGARAIFPCQELAEARTLAAAGSPPRLIGGERGGQRVPGFDFGNSPAEYHPAAVRDREIVLTTTNGTRAMELMPKCPACPVGSVRQSGRNRPSPE